ncbi:hypothetical protein OF83DRAFT_1151479 [Amylostereum chailletii]|nr:hypothetical protein OF83DRAFT_1151479 [Amylostereum chailletii]
MSATGYLPHEREEPTAISMGTAMANEISAIHSAPEDAPSDHGHLEASLANRLPPELLCQIFAIVRDTSGQHHGRLGWVSLTHVCHGWREIALQDTLLWSTIDMNTVRGRWLDERLSRSGSSPLSLTIEMPVAGELRTMDFNATAAEVAARVIEGHSDRIQTLVVFADLPKYLRTVNKLPFPALESLTFTANFLRTDERGPRPEDVSAARVPLLRVLALADIAFRWESAIYDNLVDLSLESVVKRERPSREQLRGLFSRMTRLEMLRLFNFALDDADHPPPSSKIHLPLSLKRLSSGADECQDASIRDCFAFLKEMAVPPRATTELSTFVAYYWDDEWSIWIEDVFSHHALLLSPRALSVTVSKRKPPSLFTSEFPPVIELSAFREPRAACQSPDSVAPTLSGYWYIPFYTVTPWPVEIAGGHWHGVQLGNLAELDLYIAEERDVEPCVQALLPHLVNLRRLCGYEDTVLAVVQALRATPSLLPNLETICVGKGTRTATTELFDRMVDFALERQGTKGALRELHMPQEYVGVEGVGELSKVVPVVFGLPCTGEPKVRWSMCMAQHL